MKTHTLKKLKGQEVGNMLSQHVSQLLHRQVPGFSESEIKTASRCLPSKEWDEFSELTAALMLMNTHLSSTRIAAHKISEALLLLLVLIYGGEEGLKSLKDSEKAALIEATAVGIRRYVVDKEILRCYSEKTGSNWLALIEREDVGLMRTFQWYDEAMLILGNPPILSKINRHLLDATKGEIERVREVFEDFPGEEWFAKLMRLFAHGPESF